ncbi:MAG TPA: hypothetical protein VMT23_03105 [Candidatus Binatia bacterium]|nr:hypothetical protein [Candidatus Binatia bacterium]
MIVDEYLNVTRAVAKAMGLRPSGLRELTLPANRSPTDEETLLNLSGKAHDILYSAKTVFPLDLFPDTVVLDRERLTIIQKEFFFTARIVSVPVRDILSVEVDIGPFFGSVHMSSRYFSSNPYSMNFLWRKDAIKLQRLLQGYIIAHERQIECSDIDKNDLIKLLYELG